MVEQGVLAQRVALVTGAGRGIGRAIAVKLAAAGTHLVLLARKKSELSEAAAQVHSVGGRALALKGDVARHEDVQRAVTQGLDVFGRIDILVNNAGRQPPIGPLVENDPEEWTHAVAVNLFGAFYCIQAVLPGMIARRWGKIINLSGGGATGPRPNFSAYAVSKAAIVRLTETLAEELKPFNIQVNAIAPGAINTQMLNEVLAAGDAAGEVALSQAKHQEKSGGDSLDVVVELAVFLASEESGSLTGKLISAQHDPWQEWAGKADELNATPMYTIRRLDPFTINPLIKDLG